MVVFGLDEALGGGDNRLEGFDCQRVAAGKVGR